MARSHIIIVAVTSLLCGVLLLWGVTTGTSVMGYVVAEGSAGIAVSDQSAENGTIVIGSVLTPTDAFVVVHQEVDGKPGKRLGYVWVPAGESADVVVTLDPAVEVTPNLIAAIHADRSEAGVYEFDMGNMAGSPDRPFFIDGGEVATVFAVR
jgi:hypothetical protein